MAPTVNCPKNPDNLEFLQLAQCAYADDLAVASLSYRGIMTALATAFASVDTIAGINLNYRKRCWVHCGTEERDSLRTWILENFEEFREMQIVRHANSVGTMIGPDGHLHRWTAPRRIIQRVLKINASTKSLVERLCDFKIYAISVLSFIGSVCAPDKATLKAENHALQCTTAGPYNAVPSTLLGVGSICSLGPDLVPFIPPAWRPAVELQHARPRSAEDLRKSTWLVDTSALLFSLSPIWEKEILVPSMHPLALRMHLILFVGWTVMTHLMKFRKTKFRSFWTNFINKTLLGLSLVVPREPWDRSVFIVLLTSCPT